MDAETLVEQLPNLPTVTTILQQFILSFSDEKMNRAALVAELAVHKDITSKVVRMANSPFYDYNCNVSSIEDVVIVMGFDAVRNMVLACILSDIVKVPDSFDRKAFWRASFQQAMIAKYIAELAELDGEMAFTCGILHNIGDVILYLYAPETAKNIKQAVKRGGDRTALEKNIIGVSSSDVGAFLAQRWKFPTPIISAIAQQNGPFNGGDPDVSCYAEILYLTAYIYDSYQHNWQRGVVIDGFPEDLVDNFALGQEIIFSQLNLAGLGDSFDQLAF